MKTRGLIMFKNNDFDLCILDVMMPRKDGFSLAQDIRSKNKEIPIIFLTAKTLKEVKQTKRTTVILIDKFMIIP